MTINDVFEQAFWDNHFEEERDRLERYDSVHGLSPKSAESVAVICATWADAALKQRRERQPADPPPIQSQGWMRA